MIMNTFSNIIENITFFKQLSNFKSHFVPMSSIETNYTWNLQNCFDKALVIKIRMAELFNAAGSFMQGLKPLQFLEATPNSIKECPLTYYQGASRGLKLNLRYY